MNTVIYKQDHERKTFAASTTAEMVNDEQIKNKVILADVAVIRSIVWSISGVGYVKLELKTAGLPITVAIISGNGQMDLHALGIEFESIDNVTTGELMVSTEGLMDLDGFTIITKGVFK